MNDGGNPATHAQGPEGSAQGASGGDVAGDASIEAVSSHAEPDRAVADEQLLEAVRAGDDSSYGVLYERHRSTALNVARMHTRNFQDAEDLISEAFARVLHIIRKGGGPRKFLRSYLVTTIGRLAADHGTASGKVQPVGEEEQLDRPEEFDDVVVRQCEAVSVAHAYTSLPERWQAVLWHTEVEGMKPRAVAGMLGMTPNAVSALTKRAREGLQAAYLQAQVSSVATEQCPETAQQLGAFVQGSLGSRARRQVQQHLDSCPRCTAEYLQLLDLGAGMRTWILPALAALSLWGTESKVLAALMVSGTGAGAAGVTSLPGSGTAGGGEEAAADGATTGVEGSSLTGQPDVSVVPGAQTAGAAGPAAAGSSTAGSGAVSSGAAGAAGAGASVGLAAGAGGAGLGLKFAVGAVAASAAVALVGVGVNTLVQEDGANSATTLGGLPFPASGEVTVEAEASPEGAPAPSGGETAAGQGQTPQDGEGVPGAASGADAPVMRSIASDSSSTDSVYADSFGAGMSTFERTDQAFGPNENLTGFTGQDATEYFRGVPAQPAPVQQTGPEQGDGGAYVPGTSAPSWNSGVGESVPVNPAPGPNTPAPPSTEPVVPIEPEPEPEPSVPAPTTPPDAGTDGSTGGNIGVDGSTEAGSGTGGGVEAVPDVDATTPSGDGGTTAEDTAPTAPQAFFRIQQPGSQPVTDSEGGTAAEPESSQPADEEPAAGEPADEAVTGSIAAPEGAAEPAPEPAPTTEPEPTTDPQPEPELEATVDPAPVPEATVDPAPAPEATADPAPAPEATADPAPAPEATADPAPAPEATVDPAPAPEATADPAPAPGTELAPEPEVTADPEPAPEPTAQPEPTTPPVAEPQPEEAGDGTAPTEDPGSWDHSGQPAWPGGWWIWTIKGWVWYS